MAALEGEVAFTLQWQPFELNPGMPPEGEPILDHLCRKYGRDAATMERTQEQIIAAAEALGLDFSGARERRAHDTFDAHRILAWAGEQGRETELQLALFEAYFARAENPSDPGVLRRAAEGVGLDGDEVEVILNSTRYRDSVRAAKQQFIDAGVQAVPAFIIERQYLMSGAQEPETLVDAFRQIAAESAPDEAPASTGNA